MSLKKEIQDSYEKMLGAVDSQKWDPNEVFPVKTSMSDFTTSEISADPNMKMSEIFAKKQKKIDGLSETSLNEQTEENVVTETISKSEKESAVIEKEIEKEGLELRTETAKASDEEKEGVDESEEIREIFTATKVMLDLSESVSAIKKSDTRQLVKNLIISDGVAVIDLDALILDLGIHPLAGVEEKGFVDYSKDLCERIDKVAELAGAKEVILSLGSASYRQFSTLLEKSEISAGSIMEDDKIPADLSGAQRLLKTSLTFKEVLRLVKRLRNIYKSRNISLAIHEPVNGGVMREIKKELSSAGLSRTASFNVYVVIEKASEVLLISDILSSGIDGVILDIEVIANELLGRNYGGNLSTDPIKKVVRDTIESCKNVEARTILKTSNVELAKFAVSIGIYGLTANMASVFNMKRAAEDEEKRLILAM